MGLFGIKRIECSKNQWTTLISNFGTAMPAFWNIRFKTADGEKLEGSFVEKRWWWVFPQKAVTGELKEEMQFERYWINAFYTLKIYPKVDVTVEID